MLSSAYPLTLGPTEYALRLKGGYPCRVKTQFPQDLSTVLSNGRGVARGHLLRAFDGDGAVHRMG